MILAEVEVFVGDEERVNEAGFRLVGTPLPVAELGEITLPLRGVRLA
jgi:hypothetical protein